MKNKKIHQWCSLLSDIVGESGGTVTSNYNRSLLLSDWLEALSSGDSPPVNGDTVTISGVGFGVPPNVLMWDTVDNQGDVYDLVADGALVPAVEHGDLGAPYIESRDITLSSSNTYGARGRVYDCPVIDGHLGKPIAASRPDQGHSSLFISYYMKSSIDVFNSTASSDKFARIWNDTDGEKFRSSATNHALLVRDFAGGTSIQQDIRGLGPGANKWLKVEIFVDTNTGVMSSRYHNVDTCRISNPAVITIPDVTNNGLMASLWGFDDGDDQTAPATFNFSEFYCANTRNRVELSNNPDWKRATIREVQQATSWSDNEVSFTMDAQRLDSENCWAILFNDDEEVLAVHQIGSPVAVFQDIRRPAASSICARLASEYVSTDGNFQYKADFIIMPTSCTLFRFLYSGFSGKMTYNLTTQEWLLRSGSTDLTLPATRAWDDGLEHIIDVQFTPTSVSLYIDGVLEVTSAGTFNQYRGQSIGHTSGITAPIAGYVWNVQILDLTTPSNSHYFKFDEQVGGDNNFIRDYIDNPDGVASGLVSRVDTWSYLPGEG